MGPETPAQASAIIVGGLLVTDLKLSIFVMQVNSRRLDSFTVGHVFSFQ